jgi:hypothetical protein
MIIEKYKIEYENGTVQEKYLIDKEFSSCFYKDSPLHKAIETGILKLPEAQGGEHKVKITKIND